MYMWTEHKRTNTPWLYQVLSFCYRTIVITFFFPFFFFSEGVEGEWFLTSYPIGCPTTYSSLSPTLQYYTHTSWGVVEDSKDWHIKTTTITHNQHKHHICSKDNHHIIHKHTITQKLSQPFVFCVWNMPHMFNSTPFFPLRMWILNAKAAVFARCIWRRRLATDARVMRCESFPRRPWS